MTTKTSVKPGNSRRLVRFEGVDYSLSKNISPDMRVCCGCAGEPKGSALCRAFKKECGRSYAKSLVWESSYKGD